MKGYKKEIRRIDLTRISGAYLKTMYTVLLLLFFPFLLIRTKAVLFPILIEIPSLHIGVQFLLNLPLFTLIWIGGIVLHELIHGAFFLLFTKKGLSAVKFGIMKKPPAPYCHCSEPIQVKHYLLVAVAPALLLGIIPALYSFWIGSFGMLLFGCYFTLAGTGDFLMIKLLWKENRNDYVLDHPSELGYYLLKREEK